MDTTQTKSCRFDNINPQTHDVPLASSYVYNFEDMDNPGHYKLWFVHGAYTEWITSSLAPCYFSDFLEGKDHWGRGTQPTRWIQGVTDDTRDFTTHPEYTALRLSVKDLMVKTGRPNSVSRGVHMSMLFDKDPIWVDRLIPSIPNMTLQEQEVREFDVYSAVQPPVETPLPPTNDHPSCMQLPLATCPPVRIEPAALNATMLLLKEQSSRHRVLSQPPMEDLDTTVCVSAWYMLWQTM